jgi:hypothetical protein
LIGLGLRHVQDALNAKADEIQRQFVAVSDELEAMSRRILELRGEQATALRQEQAQLRARQQDLAEEVNVWRERARSALQQSSQESIRRYLNGLLELGEPAIKAAAEHALYLLDAPPEELEALQARMPSLEPTTPAGRLLKRARTDPDLRMSEPVARERAAIEFAHRPGVAQDEAILAEIEAAMDDADPMVRELATLTAIQIHRFRAVHLADLDQAHAAVQRLAQIPHRAVVQVLIGLLENPRTGFVREGGEAVEKDNGKSRMVALLRLVEWHTPDAQAALAGRRFDRDPHIVRAAARALELFPGEWTGPLTRSLAKGRGGG